MDEEQGDSIFSLGACVDEVDFQRIVTGDADRDCVLGKCVEVGFCFAPGVCVAPVSC